MRVIRGGDAFLTVKGVYLAGRPFFIEPVIARETGAAGGFLLKRQRRVVAANGPGGRWFFTGSCLLLLLVLAAVGGAAYYEFGQIERMLSQKARESLEYIVFTKQILISQWLADNGYKLRSAATAVENSAGPGGSHVWQSLTPAQRAELVSAIEGEAKKAGFVAAGLVDGNRRWLEGSLSGDPGYFCEGPKLPERCSLESPGASIIQTSSKGRMVIHWAVPLEALKGAGCEAPRLVFMEDPDRRLFGLLHAEHGESE